MSDLHVSPILDHNTDGILTKKHHLQDGSGVLKY